MSSDVKVAEVTVGSTVWWFDPNRRVYATDATGHRAGPPIYHEHWCETTIVSETRASWTTKDRQKILKSDRRIHDRYGIKAVKFSRAEVDADVWVHDNRRAIVDAIAAIGDVEKLKRIAEIVGYVPREPSPG